MLLRSDYGRGIFVNGISEADLNRPPAGAWHEDGAILVIEDCEPLLFYLDSALIALGHHQQHLAANLAEADAVWALHKDEIRHVILNYELPDGISFDFATRILEERPLVNVIITTGYDLNAVRESCVDSKNVKFLQKPFQLRELQEALAVRTSAPSSELVCG